MPRAIRVDEDNLDFILLYGLILDFDLSHVTDDYILAAESGTETYLITDGTQQLKNVTFTTMQKEDFFNTWKFLDTEKRKMFVNIVRV